MLRYLKNSLVKVSVVSLMMVAGFASAQNQTVSADVSLAEMLSGETTSLSIIYSTTDESLTTGLGLNLHYDSSALSCDETAITDLLSDSRIGLQLTNDSADKDNDAETDKYLNIAWASIGGGWPSSSSLPVTLYTLNCTALNDFTGTTLKFSTNSSASGYGFTASDIVLTERLLPIDTTAPVITLTGNAQITVSLGGTYTELGATADTGETVSVSGSVDTAIAGTYTLTYSATDDAGNTADDVTRTVTVTGLTGTDTDGDGIIDSIDNDDDNDGIPDTLETETGRNP